jgi:hypothetical protein
MKPESVIKLIDVVKSCIYDTPADAISDTLIPAATVVTALIEEGHRSIVEDQLLDEIDCLKGDNVCKQDFLPDLEFDNLPGHKYYG